MPNFFARLFSPRRPGAPPARRPPARRMPSDLLDAVARSLAGGGAVNFIVPEGEPAREYWALRDRCGVLLDVMRRRPEPCVAVLAGTLVEEGFDEVAVRRCVGVVTPALRLPERLPDPDTGYRDRELGYAQRQGYEEAVALSGAMARYAPAEAIRVAAQAYGLAPARHEAQVLLARLHADLGQPAQAAGYLNNLVTQMHREEFRPAWARALNDAGYAEYVPQVVAEAGVPRADLTLQEARSWRLRGDPARGLRQIAAIDAAQCSDRDEYLLEKGGCEFALGQWLQTLNTLSPAVSAGSLPALRLSGLAAVRQKDWHPAVAHLRRYTAQKTDDADAWRELGHVLFTQGRYAEALAAARQAFQLTPDAAQAASLLAQSLVMSRRFEETLELCSRFPQGILSPEYLAHLLIETGMLEQASQHIDKWVTAQPHNYLAWVALGSLDERMNEPENARQHYQQALNLRGDFQPAAESLRRVEHQLGYAEW